MKKTLLGLSFLMGLGLNSYGQTSVFTQQNSNLGADYQFSSFQAIDNNTAWGLAGQVSGQTLNANTYVRTSNGGSTWQGGIVSPTNFPGYSVGGLYALDATTAWVAMFDNTNGGGLIAKTTNGGTTWTAQTTPGLATTAGTQFGTPDGFANWVYFFDANNGVCMGDANRTSTSSVNFFEIYTTSNGGTTWTRTARTSAITPQSGEYGVTNQYYAVGNTIWFTTLFDPTTITTPARVLKNTNRGVGAWTSASSTIPNRVSGLAFVNDELHGLVYNTSATGTNVVASADGGASWTPLAITSPMHKYDVAHVRGTNSFISVGLDARVTTASAATEFGVSVSTNFGTTWRDIDTGTSYTAVSFASPSVGWVGGFTTAVTGGGAIAKYNGANVLSNRSANTELQKALSAYPNPSANGVFTVTLGAVKSGATVRVVDVVGREVASQQLNATAIAAKSTTVDLSNEKAGIYTLELRTAEGVAQQKLVVE